MTLKQITKKKTNFMFCEKCEESNFVRLSTASIGTSDIMTVWIAYECTNCKLQKTITVKYPGDQWIPKEIKN